MNPEPTNAEILKVITEGQKRTDERIDAAQKHTDGRIDEILEVVNEFSTKMDKRFDGVEGRLDGVEGRLDGVEGRLDGVEGRLGKIESTMVDKDHLEDRLAKYHGDLVVLMRKEDIKVRALVEVLREKQVLTDLDVKRLITMEPFPQLSV